jgi:hypothetical protein
MLWCSVRAVPTSDVNEQCAKHTKKIVRGSRRRRQEALGWILAAMSGKESKATVTSEQHCLYTVATDAIRPNAGRMFFRDCGRVADSE